MPSKIVVVGVALAVLLTMAGFAGQSDRAFQAGAGQAAAALERLRQDGVEPSVVDGLARRLGSIREERWGPVPTAWLPEPLGMQAARLQALLATAREVEHAALADGRHQVEGALRLLSDADPGLPADELAAYRARSDRATTPAELRGLAEELRTAASTAARQRQAALELEPRVARLREQMARASDLDVDTAQASAAIASYEALLKLPARQVEPRASSVSALLQQAGESLADAIRRAEQAGPAAPPAPSRQGRAVVIDLSDQYLYAYQDGSVLLTTAVTTGRPQLRTEQGAFHVLSKSSPFLFISPWPKGSPYYYPPAWTTWAVEFIGDGTYLHDAPWQPDGTYGPGSENGSYASHGCVHVPRAVMSTLYGWLQVGDLVIVQP